MGMTSMKYFLKQFCSIKLLRIAMNNKKGKSKYFGFLEFQSPEVVRTEHRKNIGIWWVVSNCFKENQVYRRLGLQGTLCAICFYASSADSVQGDTVFHFKRSPRTAYKTNVEAQCKE
ncbi:hypothetical protein MKW98_030174 [Papaver atlanticum]|uniref:RRM domain-containing protein n=1 Tax=Papaver atlanticum TaxID=357466 RepID=A0AAD4XI51_9MAGN|nr:hypothetical protein MKW98_030174 [Papaver atlanticum]